jgi:uncharacterized coiled-coil protein SlyX
MQRSTPARWPVAPQSLSLCALAHTAGEPMTENTRLEALEGRLAHLERGLQDLSDALYRQQRELDALRLRNQQLMAEVEGGSQASSLTTPERPPHY